MKLKYAYALQGNLCCKTNCFALEVETLQSQLIFIIQIANNRLANNIKCRYQQILITKNCRDFHPK